MPLKTLSFSKEDVQNFGHTWQETGLIIKRSESDDVVLEFQNGKDFFNPSDFDEVYEPGRARAKAVIFIDNDLKKGEQEQIEGLTIAITDSYDKGSDFLIPNTK